MKYVDIQFILFIVEFSLFLLLSQRNITFLELALTASFFPVCAVKFKV